MWVARCDVVVIYLGGILWWFWVLCSRFYYFGVRFRLIVLMFCCRCNVCFWLILVPVVTGDCWVGGLELQVGSNFLACGIY